MEIVEGSVNLTEETKSQIRGIMRQISASVTFLPELDHEDCKSLSLRVCLTRFAYELTKQVHSLSLFIRRKMFKYQKNGETAIQV